MACHFIALAVGALVELAVHRAMADRGITKLPLDPEDRAFPAPSAERIVEVFAGCSRHYLLDAHGELVQTFSLELSSLQRHPLDLLGVPAACYQCADGGRITVAGHAESQAETPPA